MVQLNSAPFPRSGDRSAGVPGLARFSAGVGGREGFSPHPPPPPGKVDAFVSGNKLESTLLFRVFFAA